jgi:hypothetical protein
MKMNTIIKITALAVITALAAISCGPEAELPGVDWNAVNSKHNTELNTSDTKLYFGTNLEFEVKGYYYTYANKREKGSDFLSSTGSTIDPVTGKHRQDGIDVEFPEESDFLKKNYAKLEDLYKELEKFLSFHNFTKQETLLGAAIGKADILGDAKLAYEVVNRNEDVISLRFTNPIPNTSNVMMKIDGTKYTFANGNKMDRANRGRSGEAGYDDVYKEIDIDGILNPGGYKGFVKPENKEWQLNLTNNFNLGGSGEGSGVLPNKTDIPIASLVLGGLPTSLPVEDATKAIHQAVADQVIGGLKVQKYDIETDKWSDAGGTITFYPEAIGTTIKANTFYLNSLTLKHMEPVRVVWQGSSVPIITTDEYFGVKQWIHVYGSDSPDKHDYNRKIVYGEDDVWSDTTIERKKSAGFADIKIYSQDQFNKNVIIDVGPFSATTDATPFWLKDLSWSEKENGNKKIFTDNFKIAEANYSDVTAFRKDFEGSYIGISEVKYLSVGMQSATLPNGINTIRITLDPNYEYDEEVEFITFYVGPEVGYNDGRTIFGNPKDWKNQFFAVFPFDLQH